MMVRDAIREIRLEVSEKIGRDCYGDPVKPEFVSVEPCGQMPHRVNEIIEVSRGVNVEIVASLIGVSDSGKYVYEVQ
jgi:hypothetical protein